MHIAKLYDTVYDQQNGTFYSETIFIVLKGKTAPWNKILLGEFFHTACHQAYKL